MGEVVQSASAAWDAEHMNKPANAQHVVIKYIASLRAGITLWVVPLWGKSASNTQGSQSRTLAP